MENITVTTSQTDQIITELYAIRTGLSYNYIQNNKRINILNNIETLKVQREKKENELTYQVDKLKNEVEIKANNLYPKLKDIKKGLTSSFYSFLAFILAAAVILFAGIKTYDYYRLSQFNDVAAWFAEQGLDSFPFDIIVLLLSMIIGILIFIGILLVGAIFVFILVSISGYYHEEKINKVTSKQKTKHYNYKMSLLNSKEHENQIKLLKEENKRDINEIENQIESLKVKYNLIENEIITLQDNMSINFTSRISRVDWKYVDTLIYYFETGRTETVKESLQLLENQIQANQITQAIESSHNEIIKRIDSLSKTINIIHEKTNAIGKGLMTVYNGLEYLSERVSFLAERQESLFESLIVTQKLTSIQIVEAIEKSSQKEVLVTIDNKY